MNDIQTSAHRAGRAAAESFIANSKELSQRATTLCDDTCASMSNGGMSVDLVEEYRAAFGAGYTRGLDEARPILIWA